MTELLHKPIGGGKRPEGNLQTDPCFRDNTAKSPGSVSLCPPTSCFISFNDPDHLHFMENNV